MKAFFAYAECRYGPSQRQMDANALFEHIESVKM
jgi:hypothetical protein